MIYKLLIIPILVFSLISCVGPAANKAKKERGITPEEINSCETKTCFNDLLIKYESEILKSGYDEFDLYYENYKVRRQRGSHIRSFVHAVLSFGTLGLWNVVAYPMEGFVSDGDHLVFKVTYDDQEKVVIAEIQGG